MSWTTILTMLVLAVTSAILVMFYGWEPWLAIAVVGGGTMLTALVLLAILMWFSPHQDRSGFWSGATREMRKELRAMFATFRGK